ncbi:MAG: transposase [Endozoicomonadaceae bacterium]|nr:transposase [Endozoicomonadaceae bacterium]
MITPNPVRTTNKENSRNGYITKTLKETHCETAINTPRDRDESFESQFIRKSQTNITGMDDQIFFLHAKGMMLKPHLV